MLFKALKYNHEASLIVNIARKVESIWAVLNQMHPGLLNRLSITVLFVRISDWLTDQLVNSFLCIQNGGSEGERVLCVSSVDMSGRPRCIKTKLYYKRNFIGDNSDIKVISQKKRLPMNVF